MNAEKEYLTLSCCPSEEEAVEPGDFDYENKSKTQCQVLMDQLRRISGKEPAGAVLDVLACEHELGVYFTVVCYYDNLEGMNYALSVEDKFPMRWDSLATVALTC